MTPPDSIFDPPLQEKEQFTKPGTANVSPSDLKKLGPLMKHYAAEAHPFGSCKRDQLKHGLSEDHANRRCAVLKDLIKGTTKWRGREEAATDLGWTAEQLDDFVEEAESQLRVIAASIGAPAVANITMRGVTGQGLSESEATLHHLAEQNVVAVELFGAMPDKVGEAYNPPSWTIPKAAKAPGFKPIKPPKAKSTSSSSSSEFNRLHPRGAGETGGQFIKKGSEGPAVKAVQARLGVSTSGKVESATVKAIRQYQRRNGLLVDGIIGAQTAAALLGKSSRQPGALTGGLRTKLRSLSAPRRKLHAERVEEHVVHPSHVQRASGVKAASTSSIRTALYDLADRNTSTHTVKLPNGTRVTAPASTPDYGSYRRKFHVTNGKESITATGTDEGADVAKELDSRTKLTEGERDALWPELLAEANVSVAGYYTKSGKHVGAYSQIRKVIGGLGRGQSAHFPEGIRVSREAPHTGMKSDKFVVHGPGKGSYVQPTYGTDAAARIVGSRSASSTHPKSIGGGKAHNGISDGAGIDAVPADVPYKPGHPRVSPVQKDILARARKKADPSADVPVVRKAGDPEKGGTKIPSPPQTKNSGVRSGPGSVDHGEQTSPAKISALKTGDTVRFGTGPNSNDWRVVSNKDGEVRVKRIKSDGSLGTASRKIASTSTVKIVINRGGKSNPGSGLKGSSAGPKKLTESVDSTVFAR